MVEKIFITWMLFSIPLAIYGLWEIENRKEWNYRLFGAGIYVMFIFFLTLWIVWF